MMMTRNHLIYILFFASFALAVGQNAEPVTFPLGQPTTGATSIMDCTNQDAGTYIFTNGRGQSQDLTPARLASMPDQIFLCKGDSFDIDHTPGDLSGDPVASSPGGFGYAVYSMPPNRSGSLNQVLLDNVYSNLPTSPFFMVTQGRRDGDVTFFNECFFQDDPRFVLAPRAATDPIEVHFAPITFDSLTPGGIAAYEVDPTMGGSPGPCVDVNIDDRFSVVYLNEIRPEISTGLCALEMRITGGFPEHQFINEGDRNPRYTIDIEFLDNPNIEFETCTNNSNITALYNNPVQIRTIEEDGFLQSGNYQISITDEYSCAWDTVMNLSISCDSVDVFIGPDISGECGDTICLDVTATNFVNVIGVGLNYTFDPAVMRFLEQRNPHPLFLGTFNAVSGNPSILRSIYIGSRPGITIPPDEILVSYCFVLEDNPGECTDITQDATSDSNVTRATGLCGIPTFLSSARVCIERKSTLDISACSTTGMTGELIFGPTTGSAPFTYEIFLTSDLSTPLRDGTFNNVGDIITETGFPPGNYTIRVTDAVGIVEEDNIPIENVDRVRLARPATIIPPSCVGIDDGSFEITGTTNGVLPVDILWSTGDEDILRIDGLAGGRYAVYATDRYGCLDSISETIGADSLFLDFAAERLTDCPGDNNGVIFAEARGGNGPYTFNWSSGRLMSNLRSDRDNTASGGWNILEITDQNGCILIDSFFLESINRLDTDVEALDVSCAGLQDGSIRVTPTSGMGPYTFEWEDIGLSDSIRTGLGAGSFNVLVTDAAGCFDSLELNIIDPDSVFIAIDSVNSTNFLCPGDENGAIILNVQVEPGRDFTINWNGGILDGTFSIFNLPPDLYNFTITDERGCYDTASYEILSSDAIAFTIPDVSIPDCPGDTTFVTVSRVTGGAGAPYQFRVDNAQMFFDLGEFAPIFSGTRLIEIVDVEGCSRDTLLTIGDADPIRIFSDTVRINLGDSSRFIPEIQPFASRDSIVSYEWRTTTGDQVGLSCYDCLDPYFSGPENQVYILTATDVKGCTYDQFFVGIVTKVRNVFLPNAFTPEGVFENPGGDVRNDRLHIKVGSGVRRINYFRVYNRYGVLMHNVENFAPEFLIENGWDGRFQDVLQNPAVFVYVAEVEFIDGEVLLYRSDATLIH